MEASTTTTKERWIGLLFVVILFILSSNVAFAQSLEDEVNLAEKVNNLALDSSVVGEIVYYSEGYRRRAEAMGKQINKVNRFYSETLGIDVHIKIALLDQADFRKVLTEEPYGLPFITQGLIFQPADTSQGAVRDMYAPFAETASEEIISNLRAVGYDYGSALNLMVDLIGLHEIGHAQATDFIKDTRQPWFNEFMATYFGYAYMKLNEPKLAVVWDNITHAGFVGHTPVHTSLDVLNEIYFGVGVGDYVWFQNAFQERIREVYSKQGLEFVRVVKEKLSDPTFQPKTAKELLEVLEEIEPGFLAWAESLKS